MTYIMFLVRMNYILSKIIVFWERNHPDVITGWNTEFFDIPYLCNRIKNRCGEDD